jgi:hypothetical protein
VAIARYRAVGKSVVAEKVEPEAWVLDVQSRGYPVL